MRGFSIPSYRIRRHLFEARGHQARLKLLHLESESLVPQLSPHPVFPVRKKIEDHDAAVWLQDSVAFAQRLFEILAVMQHLARENEINLRVVDRHFLNPTGTRFYEANARLDRLFLEPM